MPCEHFFFGQALQEQRRPARELPLLAHLGVGEAHEAALRSSSALARRTMEPDAPEVEAESCAPRGTGMPRSKNLFFTSSQRNPLGLTIWRGSPVRTTARGSRGQAEQQRELHVGEVLHLVADHEVPGERLRPAVHAAQAPRGTGRSRPTCPSGRAGPGSTRRWRGSRACRRRNAARASCRGRGIPPGTAAARTSRRSLGARGARPRPARAPRCRPLSGPTLSTACRRPSQPASGVRSAMKACAREASGSPERPSRCSRSSARSGAEACRETKRAASAASRAGFSGSSRP